MINDLIKLPIDSDLSPCSLIYALNLLLKTINYKNTKIKLVVHPKNIGDALGVLKNPIKLHNLGRISIINFIKFLNQFFTNNWDIIIDFSCIILDNKIDLGEWYISTFDVDNKKIVKVGSTGA